MEAAATRLEEHLSQPVDDNPQFLIDNKEVAIWALRKLAKIESAINESRAAARAEMERIQAWLAEEEKKAEQERGFFEFHLEGYHRQQLAENPKMKTIKLPHGELQLRAQQPEYQRDDPALLAWAKENRQEFVIILPPPEPKLDWAGLKKSLLVEDGQAYDPETGELIPGLTVIEQPEKFSIKLL